MSSNKTSFSTSTGIGGGDPDRDYNPTSTSASPNQQATGTSPSATSSDANYGGGVGDRTQGAGEFGAADVHNLSVGDQYGSSGGYVPASASNESVDKSDEKSGNGEGGNINAGQAKRT